jgi:hypothetical protein
MAAPIVRKQHDTIYQNGGNAVCAEATRERLGRYGRTRAALTRILESISREKIAKWSVSIKAAGVIID